jgi:hypothetical protein
MSWWPWIVLIIATVDVASALSKIIAGYREVQPGATQFSEYFATIAPFNLRNGKCARQRRILLCEMRCSCPKIGRKIAWGTLFVAGATRYLKLVAPCL